MLAPILRNHVIPSVASLPPPRSQHPWPRSFLTGAGSPSAFFSQRAGQGASKCGGCCLVRETTEVWLFCQSLTRLLLSVCKNGRVKIKGDTLCQMVGPASGRREALMSTAKGWSLPAMLTSPSLLKGRKDTYLLPGLRWEEGKNVTLLAPRSSHPSL